MKKDSKESNNVSLTIDHELWKDWNVQIYNYASYIYFQIPNRVNVYLKTDFSEIQSQMVKFAGLINYGIGFTETKIHLNILKYLKNKTNIIMSLGVILDFIVFILIILGYAFFL